MNKRGEAGVPKSISIKHSVELKQKDDYLSVSISVFIPISISPHLGLGGKGS